MGFLVFYILFYSMEFCLKSVCFLTFLLIFLRTLTRLVWICIRQYHIITLIRQECIIFYVEKKKKEKSYFLYHWWSNKTFCEKIWKKKEREKFSLKKRKWWEKPHESGSLDSLGRCYPLPRHCGHPH